MSRLTRFNKLTNEYEYRLDNPNTSIVQDEIAGIQKLGQLEDIEEELGIDLSLLNKVFANGFSYKNENEKIIVIKPNDLFLTGLVIQPLCKRLFSGGYYFYFKDYGKTWALTKEELL